VTVSTIATGLNVPWGVAFLPDGSALVTERDTGVIDRIGTDGAVRRIGTVDGVKPDGEGGLLGLAVSPDYASDHTVFVDYTAEDDNRIAALTLIDGAISGQRVILDGLPKNSTHNGGRITFGPDGNLYVGTGDAQQRDRAQELSYLGGKILRIRPDGTGAPGNPFPDAPLIYTYGHRNVQGLAFDPQGRLWASEFGQNTWDELNLIQAGGNYGWPEVEGMSTDARFVAPQRVWPTDQASPSGIAIADGSVWMAGLRGERLWQIPLTATGTGEPVAHLTGEYGRLRTVVTAPDGSLWLTTSNTDGRGDPADGDDRILRLALD
jgi:glucose/arabinose dehydrogenase